MNIKAINNYCVIETIQPASEIKKGRIILPSVVEVTPRWSKVLSSGEGVWDGNGTLRKPDVDPGDTVYVTSHGQFSLNTGYKLENIAAASVLDILVKLEDMETLKIQPLGSYIEIEKIEVDSKSQNGIEMPDDRKAPTNLGRVITVGIGWTGPYGDPIPMQVKPGDKVVYSPLRTMVVDFTTLGKDEKKYLIQHGDIIGIVEE